MKKIFENTVLSGGKIYEDYGCGLRDAESEYNSFGGEDRPLYLLRGRRKRGYKMTGKECNILLFSITLCWASSYIFIKNLPEELSSYAYLTLTCGLAVAVMAAVFVKKLKKCGKKTWIRGFFLSLILTANLLLEKKGISMLEPANASFMAALTIIMVPVLLLFLHKKLTPNHMVGAAIILTGLCVSNGFEPEDFCSPGTLFMLGGCVSSAGYTIAVDSYAKEEDPLLLCIVQMFFTALTGFILWSFEDPGTFAGVPWSKELLSNIFILAFFAKAYAYITLMFSQKYTDAVSVTVIASTEPIVTLVLSLLLPAAYGGGESFRVSSAVGALMIAAGAIVAGLSFQSRKKGRKSVEKEKV